MMMMKSTRKRRKITVTPMLPLRPEVAVVTIITVVTVIIVIIIVVVVAPSASSSSELNTNKISLLVEVEGFSLSSSSSSSHIFHRQSSSFLFPLSSYTTRRRIDTITTKTATMMKKQHLLPYKVKHHHRQHHVHRYQDQQQLQVQHRRTHYHHPMSMSAAIGGGGGSSSSMSVHGENGDHDYDYDDDDDTDDDYNNGSGSGDNDMKYLYRFLETKMKNFLLSSSSSSPSQYVIKGDNNDDDIDMDTDSGSRGLSNTTMDRMVSFVVNNDPNLLKLLLEQHGKNQPELLDRDAQTTSTEASDTATSFATNNTEVVKMVIFDKDGTLGDCNASLKRWVDHMVRMIRTNRRHTIIGAAAATGTTTTTTRSDDNDSLLHQNFYDKVGWDSENDQVTPSAPVAAGTWEQITDIVYEFLMEHRDQFGYGGVHRSRSNNNNNSEEDPSSVEASLRKLAKEWSYGLDDLHGGDDPVIDNLKGMMEECHEMGYLVAVCTSDDRAGTDQALKAWGIDKLVDVSICGDEVNGHGKPSPVPLQLLCERATEYAHQNCSEEQTSIRPTIQITPQNCVMVGDTTADTGMAVAANVGLCVGVLTGSGTTEQLLGTGADLVLDDVGHIPTLFRAFERVRRYALDEQNKTKSVA